MPHPPERSTGSLLSVLPLPFQCTSTSANDRTLRLEASGELDLLTTPDLERELAQLPGSARLVVLDLHALTFIDTSGVHAIEEASLRVLMQGRRLVVSRAPDHVARILSLTGMLSIVELLHDGPSA